MKPTVTPEDIAKAREFMMDWGWLHGFVGMSRSALLRALASFRAAARAEGEKRGLKVALDYIRKMPPGEDAVRFHLIAVEHLRALAAEEGEERE